MYVYYEESDVLNLILYNMDAFCILEFFLSLGFFVFSIVSSSSSSFFVDDLSIDFGRVPKWNCPQPEGEPETSANAPSPATYLLQQSTQQNTQTTTIRTTTVPSTTTTTTPTTTTVRTMTTTTGKPPKTPDSSSFSKNSGGARDGGDENNSIAEYKAPATAPSPTSWQVPPIPCYEPDDRVYYAQLGPTGGAYGYRSITGCSFLSLPFYILHTILFITIWGVLPYYA